jgi:hypothetical protein
VEDLFDPESLTLCIPVPNARNHVGATVRSWLTLAVYFPL